ncbi:hypothetical protein OX284_004945 [Flavobacterium sp. SUN046]|uniref:hypothetical protein n=1 Tax=Flavobacterium sp. SUN046 TaxID=3002440 RepID=UPI002DBE720B|nr:hypothetical protein [Flavobacterium sp. SUN046]MEC4048768.1 hypothetical protein [Flavobacterium sp. SUN046]
MTIENDRKEAGRPFKMQAWVNALTRILEDENVIFLSDKDLVLLTNRLLPEEQKITSRTFENWKAGKFHENEQLGKEFIGCIEFALIKQKQLLGDRLMNDNTGQWTRYAWILERKFAEWNLKSITENINKNEQSTVIQITAGNEEQRALIDNLINHQQTDFVEIKPKQISSIDNEKEDEIGF